MSAEATTPVSARGSKGSPPRPPPKPSIVPLAQQVAVPILTASPPRKSIPIPLPKRPSQGAVSKTFPIPTIPVTSPVAQPSSEMSWKERGDFHLKRGELDLAKNAFGNALELTLKENVNVAIACKDMGVFYLTFEKTSANPWHKRQKLDDEKWTLAAKYLAIAYAQYEKQTPRDENALKLVASHFTELEKALFEKEWGITSSTINAEDYFKQRAHLKQLRENLKTRLAPLHHA